MQRKIIPLLALLLLFSAGKLIASHIAALPLATIQNGQTSLQQTVRQLQSEGYGILHYDSTSVIALVPDAPSKLYEGFVWLAPYPSSENLWIVGKLPGEAVPAQAGKLLWEMDNACLVSNSMDEIALRPLLRHPFAPLNLEPLRFPDTGLSQQSSSETRTEIDQMVAMVNTASVQSLLQNLQDFQTRYARASNRQQVAEWIRQKFISFGITDVVLQQFTWQNTDQYNVVATIPGTVYPNQYIIVGGHHDSISGNSDPYTTAPGADDNASGSVAALEMARVMMQSGYQPKTSIRFVTFAAEEFGLWGSKHFAQTAMQAGMNIRLMINHDMIANNTSPGPWLVRLMPYDGSLEHSSHAAQITEQYTTLDAYYGNLNSPSSDSSSFFQAGYNVIYFFESDFSPVYHTDQDIIANLNPDYCTEVIRASLACAATFADMPSAPANLEVFDTGSGNSLYMSWDQSPDPSVSQYRVYYSETGGQWGTPQVTSVNHFTLTGLTENQVYYVAVSSVDSQANESYMVYSSGTPRSVPLTPAGFRDQPQTGGIALNWEANTELDLQCYRLYRSQDGAVLGDLLATIQGAPSYTDNAVEGSHNYYYYSLYAVDQGGNTSPSAAVLRSRPLTLDQGVLIVDETSDLAGTNPLQPSDQQADDFYAAIAASFTPAQLDLHTLDGDMRLADLSVYSSILWHGNDLASMDYPYFHQEVLREYIEAGGNIFFSTYKPSFAFDLNATYPNSFLPNSFINSVIGIGGCNLVPSARFRYATPAQDQFPAISVDPDKTTTTLNGHILLVESISPNPNCATVYNYGSDYAADSPQGAMNGMPVAVLNMNRNGKVFTTSIPLYNIHQNEAKSLVDYVFTEYFDETSTALQDPQAVPSPGIRIHANYPNPFRGLTSFRVDSKDQRQKLSVGIYNLRGQQVRQLYAGPGAKSRVFDWDGSDASGAQVASGVYIIRVSQGSSSALRKMLLLR